MDIEQASDASELIVVLSIGRLSLVFPQRDIRTLEPVLDLEAGEHAQSIGDIVLEEGTWPIFALNENLDLLGHAPENGRVCVLMTHQQWRFGLLCEQVKNSPSQNVRPEQVPDCMRQEDAVVRGLALVANQVMCLTRAETIWRHLDRLGCQGARSAQPEPRDLTQSTLFMTIPA